VVGVPTGGEQDDEVKGMEMARGGDRRYLTPTPDLPPTLGVSEGTRKRARSAPRALVSQDDVTQEQVSSLADELIVTSRARADAPGQRGSGTGWAGPVADPETGRSYAGRRHHGRLA